MPKQIALRDPESVAVRVAPAMTLLAKISPPAVWLLDRSGKALLWLLGQRGEAGEKVSEDEIRTLVVEAENAGVLEPGEKEMIAGVMRLGDLPVGAVMTPRREVSMIDLSDAPEAIRSALTASGHSRFVVFDRRPTPRSASSTPRIFWTAICRDRSPICASWFGRRR